ncbi:hypothetical protein EPUL_006693 [Erysiphe pulchra]|uniref:Uncharacterized protein n=1 Tax=Erysiphe pulchra TaxID=225359 RepID=A0A2S4PND1_9PEZI|nr:hypothetical protein EPUL_006693 [Erysiphe pulchra]
MTIDNKSDPGSDQRSDRAVLPVSKTTPVAAVLCEIGWGPATTWLERFHDHLAIRVAAADLSHPLCKRWKRHLTFSRLDVETTLSFPLALRRPHGTKKVELKSRIASGKIPLASIVENYDTELIGATEGLKVATNYIMTKFAATINVAVCLDSEEASNY